MEEDHITRLIIRYLSHEASPKEEETLLEWISRDNTHQQTFNDWVEIWNGKPEASQSFELTKGLKKLNAKIDSVEVQQRSFVVWRKIAAAVLVILATSATLLWIAKSSAVQSDILLTEHHTRAGEKISLKLPDGSSVLLNANSSLKYPENFDTKTREVYLSGEAFFDVVKNPGKPFIIRSGEITTQVLGTSFNMHSRADSAVVSVVTGRVQVTGEDALEVLLPQEKAIYNASKKSLVKRHTNLDSELAWKNNTIILEDSKLSSVAERLHEFYGYDFLFENDNLKKCHLTGRFTDQPIDAVLKAVSFSTGAQYRVEGMKVTLYGQGCE